MDAPATMVTLGRGDIQTPMYVEGGNGCLGGLTSVLYVDSPAFLLDTPTRAGLYNEGQLFARDYTHYTRKDIYLVILSGRIKSGGGTANNHIGGPNMTSQLTSF